MTTVQKVISYLSNQHSLEVLWKGTSDQLSAELLQIQADSDAGKGCLAWISTKQYRIRPLSIEGFQGALLLGPLEADVRNIPFLGCSKPKLAFILTVTHFFSERIDIEWPGSGESVLSDAKISPSARLASGVVIGPRVTIADSVEIGPNTVLANVTIQKNVKIGANCSIGLAGFGYEADEDGGYWRFPHTGGVFIDEGVEIGSNTCIDRGSIGDTIIGKRVKIDNLVHVAHNVNIGADTLIIANAMLGGSVIIEEGGWVAPSVSIMNQVKVGAHSVIGLGAVVLKNVDDRSVMVGNPAKLLRRNEE